MWVKVKIDTKKLISWVLDKVYPVVKYWTDEFYNDVRINSPVDTWEYKASHQNLWVRREWYKIIWTIWNTDEKAVEVEFWFSHKSVNRHPTGLPVYEWVWARVYTRAEDKIRKKLITRFKKLW